MKYIYYNVSGIYMEILQFIISFLDEEFNLNLSPLINSVKENGFDIKSIISSLSPETIESILSAVGGFFKNQNPTNSSGDNYLSPISGIADEFTVSSLNGYFLSPR